MLNLQRLLQKKKNEDTAENTGRAGNARGRKKLVLSMAAVFLISFLAPPVGTDRFVLALAAVLGGEKELQETDAFADSALMAAVRKENEEAVKVMKTAAREEKIRQYKKAGEQAVQTLRSFAFDIYENVWCEAQDELQLLELSEKDNWKESEDAEFVQGGQKEQSRTNEKETAQGKNQSGANEKETAQNTQKKAESKSDIPEALSLVYNEKYASMKLSKEQLTVLETIVEAEAGDEDAYGKILVANVVLNRVLDEEFPDTVKEVVFQNNGKTYQFSPVRKGGRYYTVKVSAHTREAVARALAGEDYSDGALYFFARRYTSAKKAKWFDTSLRKIVEYGCHEFFGNK